jgi:hypothetical protein
MTMGGEGDAVVMTGDTLERGILEKKRLETKAIEMEGKLSFCAHVY